MTGPLSGSTSSRLGGAEQRPVRVGLIGCGAFGAGILAQAAAVPGLELLAVADRNLDTARRAHARAGVPDDAITVCESPAAAQRALEAGKRVIAADPLLLMELPLDVIAEATGQPESGAFHAEMAIRHGKHVAMVTKEADATVGPILNRLAEESGLVYTPVDGDQHGLLIGMVAWAHRLGLEILCGGKSRDQELVLDRLAGTFSGERNPVPLSAEEARAFEPLPAAAGGPPSIEARLAARQARLGGWGRVGGWDLVELVIAVNATGLVPDLPDGVHCPAVFISEIPQVLCPAEMGGILRSRGVIDAVTCLSQPHEAGLGGGVFLVVTTANAAAREVLSRGGVCTNAGGTATLITRPYHLLGIEAITTILAVARGDSLLTAREYRPRFDVLIRAARDLGAGTVLGDDHSPDLEALIGPAAPVANDRPLPAHLANGNRLLRPVPRGTVITREMVAAPVDSPLWALRARQDACFLMG